MRKKFASRTRDVLTISFKPKTTIAIRGAQGVRAVVVTGV
jgi:hypothetical protein